MRVIYLIKSRFPQYNPFNSRKADGLVAKPEQKQQSKTMIKNFFKIALRNLWRNKGFSAINIFGLAIGMASAILILLWIQNEVSHDRFHKKIDRIYIMNNRDHFNGELHAW